MTSEAAWRDVWVRTVEVRGIGHAAVVQHASGQLLAQPVTVVHHTDGPGRAAGQHHGLGLLQAAEVRGSVSQSVQQYQQSVVRSEVCYHRLHNVSAMEVEPTSLRARTPGARPLITAAVPHIHHPVVGVGIFLLARQAGLLQHISGRAKTKEFYLP